MILHIKKDKTSFYQVDGWIAKYDYERKDRVANLIRRYEGKSLRKIRKNPFARKNWNSPNNRYPMVLEFKDPLLGMSFLLQMSEFVEKIV